MDMSGVNWQALERQRESQMQDKGFGQQILGSILGAVMNVQAAKQKAKYDPDTMLMNSILGSQTGVQPSMPVDEAANTPFGKLNDSSGNNNRAGIGREQLIRGLISKKFGIPYEQMMNPEERQIAQEEKLQLSPMFQEGKAKRTEELFSQVEQNKVSRKMIDDAKISADKIPTGLGGRMNMWWMKMFDSNNPTMEDWQKVKMVLTDAQLLNTAKTKGAISDSEMKLFSSAAANDDIASIAAMKPVFNKLINFINSEEKAKIQSYQKTYKENPDEFLGTSVFSGKSKTTDLKSKYNLE